MRVAVNAVHLVPGETGGFETYARRLLPLLAAEEGLDIVVLTGVAAAALLAGEGLEVERIPVDARSRTRAVLAEQIAVPRALRRIRADLLHNLFNTAPGLPGLPQVTTIHDVIYRHLPQTHAGILSWGLRVLVPLAARRSRRVIAVSEATKSDVVDFLGVGAERVDVVPNGPGLERTTEPTTELELRRRLGLEGPIVLSASAKRPHKNLERLIEAMVDVDATLVLPGYRTPFESSLEQLATRLEIGDRLRLTGWLDDADLEGLYAAAECVVVPSLIEGFGLPALEAMVRGAPVACSAIPALEEVVGEAALLFDPYDPSAISSALRRLLSDHELRSRLRDAGLERAALFTWSAAAGGTRASYERALRAPAASGRASRQVRSRG